MNASHAVAPLSRLLWKEYRAQRSLWLAMLMLGVLPQILMRIAIGDIAVRAGLVWVMVGVLPFLFVIGSTAILFAGEREERTVDWLLNLAVPPQWTLLTKWAFLLVATLALAATLSVSALLLVWTGPGMADSDQWRSQGYQDEMIVFRWMMVFAGVFLWGVLGSLVSRRVMTAVPAGGFLWLMTFVVPMIWFPSFLGFKTVDPQLSHLQDRMATSAFVAVAIANLVLGWLWCQGRYFDATILDGINSRIITWWNHGQVRRAMERLPQRIEFDSLWRREWQRLIWQERHRDRYHRGLFYMGLVIIFLLAVMEWKYGVDCLPAIIPLIVMLPMIMGVLGFRYDGEGLPLRFLSYRGIEARLLWLAKHAVWLPRAIWIPLSVWFIAGVVQALLVPHLSSPPGWQLLQLSMLRTDSVGMVAFILLSYGCGHLAAISFRRTIMAFVVAVTASLLATLWLLMAVRLEVPLWWSVGGLALWIFSATFLAMPSWMIERSLPGRKQRLAAYTLPLVLLIAMWGAWRAYEIPGIHPNILSGRYGLERVDAASFYAERLKITAVAMTPNDQQVLDRLGLLMGGFNQEQDFVLGLHRDGAVGMDPNQPADPVEAFWFNNEPRLKELLDITSHTHGPSVSPWLEFSRPSDAILPLQTLLLEAGRMRTREGRLADAFSYYMASLRLTSFWATDSGLSTRVEAQQQRLLTLDRIVQWGSHPDQTGEKLRAARDRLQVELELFPSMDQTLVAEHRIELTALRDTIQRGARWDGRATSTDSLMVDYFRFLPWEKVRAQRLLERQLLDGDRRAREVAGMLRQPGVDVGRRLDEVRLH
ncbi:MAG TPA: hypothetical protein VGM98_00560, partial [Schlesneria sp.]